jgi:hypothetical protein
MRIVIALGGNALLRQREPMTAQTQRANVKRAVAGLLPLFEAGHQLVITHGNGPQVGLLALQAAAGPKDGAYPLDVLGAESEGMVGYLIEQELDNVLPGGHLVAFDLPTAGVRKIDRLQRRFVTECRATLAARVRRRHIVDGHGDLRPEHIWLDHEVRIIDCLEFNPRLRAVDPFDEIAFPDLECERLGAAWARQYIRSGVQRGLHEDLPAELYHFYRSYRATLRARLAIARLSEPNPRTPEKWPRLARAYLDIAARDAAALGAASRTRRDQ